MPSRFYFTSPFQYDPNDCFKLEDSQILYMKAAQQCGVLRMKAMAIYLLPLRLMDKLGETVGT